MAELRSILERAVRDFSPREDLGLDRTRRIAGRRQFRGRTAALAVGVALSAGVVALASWGFGSLPSRLGSTPQPGPTWKATHAGIRPTSPIVEAGRGVDYKMPWSLTVQTGETETGSSAVCSDLLYDPQKAGGVGGCTSGYPGVASEANILAGTTHRLMDDPNPSAYVGPVPSETEQVVIDSEVEPPREAKLFGPFPEIVFPVKFVVAFAPPSADVTITGHDATGAVLWSYEQTATWALEVFKDGEGEGEVIAYHDYIKDPIGNTPHPARVAFKCGHNCLSFGHGHWEHTLVAEPSVGSTFAGWKGACEGQSAACHLKIRDDTTTTAIFERG